MRRLTGLSSCALIIAVAACGESGEAPAPPSENEIVSSGPIAEAPSVPLVGPGGEILGEVSAGDGAEGAVFKFQARGLPPGEHGLHIHDAGLCEGPGFTTAGGHWNPEGKQHGTQNPQGPHKGDLPNVTVGADGSLNTSVTAQGTPLAGQILDANGAALVVHAGPDDMKTDPSGDSGDRIACAVLGTGTDPAAAE